ncbi:MAG: 5-formyltetrahydrofolate cyclo-ligase [Deltaproteobacteria bacterium]|nr:5-formyltetrahydrofolate cyclo-ligase [Deltaproteobacteria bacterium]
MSELLRAKAEWRVRLRARLAAMTPGERTAQSRRICESVSAREVFRRAPAVLLYRPLPSEVDVTALWREAEARGCRTFFPRMRGPNQPLRFVRVHADTEWRASIQPFLEPQSDEDLSATEARDCVIIVPGLGFSPRGGRLGRGQGYFDRTLVAPPLGGQGYRIGVAFAEQLVEDLPIGLLDVPMHAVVSSANAWIEGLQPEAQPDIKAPL